MCQYCEIEPVFTKDVLGRDVYDKDKSQKVLKSGGMYSDLVIGFHEDSSFVVCTNDEIEIGRAHV